MSVNLELLATRVVINEKIVSIRPIVQADIEREQDIVKTLSPNITHTRVLGGDKGLSNNAAYDLGAVDYDNKMAFIATYKVAEDEEQDIGVARYAVDEFDHCEFAVSVADVWQNHGLGTALMKALISFARDKKKELIYSLDLADNTHMHQLARDLGMNVQREPDDATVLRYELTL